MCVFYSLLSAASQSLQMLPLAEQFIIQRSPVMIASFTSEPSARNAVDVQSMISLSSVPSLNGRADSAFGMAKLTEGDVGGVIKIPANTSDIIRALCEHLMFNEALNIAFQSTTLTCAGAGVDGLEPLSAAMSSVSLNADSGMGLFVHFLTTFCCKAGSTDSTVCTGLKGHVVSPLSNWNYNAIIFDCGYAKSNNLWYYLADILRVFDGPQMGNWGLHRIAVLACIAARPGRKLPENLVRSFCSDLLIPTNGEKRQGNGMGLLRLLYEHGHILEACNLASRIINDFIDPRNKLAHSNNTQKVPQIPFTFLDELIFAIDRILKAAGNSASNSSKTRAIVCAALTDSQASLKRAIEIMIKVNLINSYN